MKKHTRKINEDKININGNACVLLRKIYSLFSYVLLLYSKISAKRSQFRSFNYNRL